MAENGKPRILVVDDEPEILDSLYGLLRLEFDVQTAASGREALEILERQTISVVMTDQRMPEMTGVELLRLLQDQWPDTVRMVFTGYADVQSVVESINDGHIFRYVTKPWDPDELCRTLKDACREYALILERRRLLSDLREQEAGYLALVQRLRDGRLGALNDEGQETAGRLALAGRELLGRLDRYFSQANERRSDR